MINANELRLGNTIEYHILYKLDGTDEWVDNTVDIVKLQYLLEDPNHPLYRPKVLTEECLVEFGFEKQSNKWKRLCICNDWSYLYWENLAGLELSVNKRSCMFPHIRYVHQLENLYFTLTGQELKKKEVES